MVATTIGMIVTSLLLNQIGKIDGTSPMLDITPTYHFVMGSFAFGMVLWLQTLFLVLILI